MVNRKCHNCLTAYRKTNAAYHEKADCLYPTNGAKDEKTRSLIRLVDKLKVILCEFEKHPPSAPIKNSDFANHLHHVADSLITFVEDFHLNCPEENKLERLPMAAIPGEHIKLVAKNGIESLRHHFYQRVKFMDNSGRFKKYFKRGVFPPYEFLASDHFSNTDASRRPEPSFVEPLTSLFGDYHDAPLPEFEPSAPSSSKRRSKLRAKENFMPEQDEELPKLKKHFAKVYDRAVTAETEAEKLKRQLAEAEIAKKKELEEAKKEGQKEGDRRAAKHAAFSKGILRVHQEFRAVDRTVEALSGNPTIDPEIAKEMFKPFQKPKKPSTIGVKPTPKPPKRKIPPPTEPLPAPVKKFLTTDGRLVDSWFGLDQRVYDPELHKHYVQNDDFDDVFTTGEDEEFPEWVPPRMPECYVHIEPLSQELIDSLCGTTSKKSDGAIPWKVRPAGSFFELSDELEVERLTGEMISALEEHLQQC